MSNNFEATRIDLGLIKGKSKQEIIFKAKRSLDIAGLKPSCGCSSAVYKKFKRQLVINYKPGTVPSQVKAQFMTVYKTIDVLYKDGSVEVLTFSAQIEKD